MYKIGDKVTYINGSNGVIDCVVTSVEGREDYDMLSISSINDGEGSNAPSWADSWTNVCADYYVIPTKPPNPWEGNVLKFRFGQ